MEARCRPQISPQPVPSQWLIRIRHPHRKTSSSLMAWFWPSFQNAQQSTVSTECQHCAEHPKWGRQIGAAQKLAKNVETYFRHFFTISGVFALHENLVSALQDKEQRTLNAGNE